MSAILGINGVLVYEDELIAYIGIDKYVAMKRKFVRTVFLQHNQTKSARLVEITKDGKRNVLTIKRFLAFIYLQDKLLKDITNVLPVPMKANILDYSYILTPYPIQILAHDYVYNNIFNNTKIEIGNSGCIVELEAGKGKTALAAMLIRSLNYKTLYVVANEYLMNQAYKDLKGVFPDMPIGLYHSKQRTDGIIVIMIINSVLSDDFVLNGKIIPSADYFSRFGLSVWDEIQDYATPSRSVAFTLANTRCMLGLTAEANHRLDKMDFINHYSCGPVIVVNKLPGYIEDEKIKYKSICTIVKYSGPPEYTENIINDKTNMMMVSHMNRMICQDPYRMTLAINKCIQLYTAGKNFFVWCDMRCIVLLLEYVLSKYGIMSFMPEVETNTTVLMGGTSMDTVNRAQTARVIVATYQYAYKGISLPRFDSMIFFTPRKSHIYQTLKRIYRSGGDSSITREIYDIVDENTGLKTQLSSRKKEYKRDVFDMYIKQLSINYQDITPDPNLKLILKEAVTKYIDESNIRTLE